jgi:hypothetical protein
MKRGGGHLRTEEFLILGFFELEEGQRAAVADPEETMTIASHRAEELVRLAPSGNQRKAQQILVKSSCRLEILADVSGVMEPAWDFALNAQLSSLSRTAAKACRAERRRARVGTKPCGIYRCRRIVATLVVWRSRAGLLTRRRCEHRSDPGKHAPLCCTQARITVAVPSKRGGTGDLCWRPRRPRGHGEELSRRTCRSAASEHHRISAKLTSI